MERGCVQCRWERGREGQERLWRVRHHALYAGIAQLSTGRHVRTSAPHPSLGGGSPYSYTMTSYFPRDTIFTNFYLSEFC